MRVKVIPKELTPLERYQQFLNGGSFLTKEETEKTGVFVIYTEAPGDEGDPASDENNLDSDIPDDDINSDIPEDDDIDSDIPEDDEDATTEPAPAEDVPAETEVDTGTDFEVPAETTDAETDAPADDGGGGEDDYDDGLEELDGAAEDEGSGDPADLNDDADTEMPEDDTGGEGGDTGEEGGEDAGGEGENEENNNDKDGDPGTDFESTRRYTLYQNYLNLYTTIMNYINSLDNSAYDDPEMNHTVKTVSAKLKQLSEILYDYMIMRFENSSYTQALLFYKQTSAAVYMCFNLLEKGRSTKKNTK